jgi:hypothetical protein
MSKEEILEYYKKFEKKRFSDKDSIKIIRFNNDLEIKTQNLIDSLSNESVDTLMIFSVSYPGYLYSDKACVKLLYPIDIYMFWKQGDDYNEKRIINGCDSEILIMKSTSIIDFFIENLKNIEGEMIMPIIYDAILNADSTMNFSTGSVSHEPKYSIYIKYGNDYTQKIFTENDLLNDESLFYNYNLKLKTYQLFKLIETRIGTKTSDK